MGFIHPTDHYFTYESRLASFRKIHSASRRRASNTSARGPKTLKWPHKFLSTQELAKAGFFYLPTPVNLDNVSCFLCHKSLDGWEETDNPLVEHLRHSPECGWAITATIERSDGEWSEEDPLCTKILEARKATFSDKWPHESKKGWKCHVKQMIEAGWKYTPTPESNDMVTCSYCNLALSNWGKNDKPFDKHCECSPDCPFFAMSNSSKQNIRIKNTNLKRARAPRISRLSAQSNQTVTTNASREASLPVEEEDSILTRTSVTSQKTLQERKLEPIKVRRTRSKKNETIAVIGREATNQRVRGSNTCRKKNIEEIQPAEEEDIHNSPKRRITRNRGSIAVDKNRPSSAAVFSQTAKTRSKIISNQKKLSTSNKSSAKPAPLIDVSAIERALEADLVRPLSDDDEGQEMIKSKITRNSIHTITNLEPIDKDEEVIESEIITKNKEVELLPNVSNANGSLYTKKNIDPRNFVEIESQKLGNQDSILQGAVVPDHSPSPNDLLPQNEPVDKGCVSNRQATRILPNRKTRGSTPSTQNNDSINSTTANLENDPENKTLNQSNCNRNDLTEQPNEKERCFENIRGTNDNSEKPDSCVVAQGSDRPNKRKKPSQNVETDAARSESGGPSVKTSGDKIIENDATKLILSKKKICNGLSRDDLSPPSSSQQIIRANPKNSFSKSQDSTSHSRYYSITPPVNPTSPKEATSHSTLYSDAENQPPSPKNLVSNSTLNTPPKTRRVVIVNSATPLSSLHRPAISVGGLISDQPWTAVDADMICVKSPSTFSFIDLTRNVTASVENDPLEHAFEKARQGELTSFEEKMTIAEWIKYNAQLAEEKLRHECESMVNKFEREGTRAIRALEGVECLE
ncbi:putative at hook domain-containing protein [Golovinomyces cichoracearum]|uniref:Putative at hook domain-containing protein n=1 Tax=Golovinomyces cichoracearum TaxID=62708 RepID=A0A420ILA0_9PEZI|nr:putative at hook domain-containing protein [Golovinomyces cichoracearum]